MRVRQRDRQTDRQTVIDGETDRQTVIDRETDRQKLKVCFILVEVPDSHETFGQVSLEMNLSRRPASGGVDGTIRGNYKYNNNVIILCNV